MTRALFVIAKTAAWTWLSPLIAIAAGVWLLATSTTMFGAAWGGFVLGAGLVLLLMTNLMRRLLVLVEQKEQEAR